MSRWMKRLRNKEPGAVVVVFATAILLSFGVGVALRRSAPADAPTPVAPKAAAPPAATAPPPLSVSSASKLSSEERAALLQKDCKVGHTCARTTLEILVAAAETAAEKVALERLAYDHAAPLRARVKELTLEYDATLTDIVTQRRSPHYVRDGVCESTAKNLAQKSHQEELNKLDPSIGGASLLAQVPPDLEHCAGCDADADARCNTVGINLQRIARLIQRDEFHSEHAPLAPIPVEEAIAQAKLLCWNGRLAEAAEYVRRGRLTEKDLPTCVNISQRLLQSHTSKCSSAVSVECDEIADGCAALNFAFITNAELSVPGTKVETESKERSGRQRIGSGAP